MGRAWVLGEDTGKTLRQEIQWQFVSVPGPNIEDWPEHIRRAQLETELPRDPDDEPAAQASATYLDLCNRVGPPRPAQRAQEAFRRDFQRSATARRAVLLRCEGRCESTYCTGMPGRPAKDGSPILEVDHIMDLGRGGDDHPTNMIAMCPNCHAVKTRGSQGDALRRELAVHARLLHNEYLAAQG